MADDIVYEASLDDSEILKALKNIDKNIDKLANNGEKSFKKIEKSSKLSAKAIGFVAGITQELTRDFINLGKQALRSIEQAIIQSVDLAKIQVGAENQLAAAIRSTGNATGLTAEELKNLASELQNVTNYGDEATIKAEALLLTFKSIGGDVFPRALKSILDVSTAMGQDLQSSVIQIGKALNEPVEGLSALRRVGIQFTDAQEKQIKTLVESGKVAEAQAVILAELESQFGGSAEAAREADGGVTAFANAIGDLQEKIGLPILESLSENIESVLQAATDGQVPLDNLATAVGQFVAAALDLIGSGIFDILAEIDPDAVDRLAESLKDAAAALSEFLELDITADINGLINTLTILTDAITTVTNGANKLSIGFSTVQAFVKPIRDAFISILFPIYKLIEAFGALKDLVEAISGVDVLEAGAEVSRIIADNSESAAQAAEKAAKMIENYGENAKKGLFEIPITSDDIIDPELPEDVKKALDKLADLERDAARDRIDIIRKADQKAVDAEVEFQEKRIDQARKYLQQLEDVERKNAQAITDSAKDLSRDEEDARRDFNRKQIDLEKDQAKKRIEIEEDLQEEIRRINSRFEFDADEAARKGDAVTLLRLQRERDRQIGEAKITRTQKVQESDKEGEEKRQQLKQELDYELQDAKIADERRLEDLRVRLQRELEETRLNNDRALEDIAIYEQRKRAELDKSLMIQLQEAQIANNRRVQDFKDSLDAEIAALIAAEQEKTRIMKEAIQSRKDLDRERESLADRLRSQGRTSRLGGRQHGGPVGSGQPVIVGEAGPEIFQPSVGGNVIPLGPGIMNALSGGPNISNTVNYNQSANVNQNFGGAQDAITAHIARNAALETIRAVLSR